MIKNITLGTDPEFFLFDKTISKIVPAVGLIGGSKYEPLIIPSGEAVLEDNVMVEFTTTICKNASELTDSINRALKHLREKLGTRYDFVFNATHNFDWQDLTTEQAMLFGCELDYNAYTKKANTPPDSSKESLRSCSGHVHIGFEDPTLKKAIDLVKLLDLYLGVPSVLLDEDRERRKLYGRAGCFRPKPYGKRK